MEHIERMKYAFALHVTRALVNADDAVHEQEVALVQKSFPLARLEELGFVEPGGQKLTPAFHALRREAVDKLPTALSHAEKLEFVAWLKQVCEADGHVDEREAEIVARTEKLLGLP